MKAKIIKDDAVSPVIGVMMMLVVTILIAAVVTMFASGMTTSTDTAPTLSVKLDGYVLESYGSGYYTIPEATLKHMSGDIVDLDDIKVEIIFNFATRTFSSLDDFDSNGDGKWTPGESITIYDSKYGQTDPNTYSTSIGFTNEAFTIPAEITTRLLTKSGEVICETDLTLTLASATKIYGYNEYPTRT